MLNTLQIFSGLMLDFFIKNSGEFFAVLSGAFFGAACAFWFERAKEKRKKQNEEYGAIVRSQMVLIAQLNTVNNIKKQHLDPFRNDPEKAKKLIQFRMTDASLRVAYDSISFLLMTKNPTLVLDVHAAEQSYLSAIECLKWKNEAYEKMHENSILEKVDTETGACSVSVKDPRYLMQVEFLTDALYKAVDSACARLDLQIKELNKAGKLIYPQKKFLEIAGEKEAT